MIRLPEAWIKKSFRLLYHRGAFLYEAVAWLVSLGRWSVWRETALPFIEQEPVLEIGCGSGALIRTMAKNGLRSTGIDLSPDMLRIAKRTLRRAGLSGSFCLGDSHHLPFKDRSFGTVVATFPTGHIFEVAVLEEIHRELFEHGKLVLVISGRFESPHSVQKFIDILFRLTRQEYDKAPEAFKNIRNAGFEYNITNIKGDFGQVDILTAEKS
jgi:ubiquinone/menaquinone biosynthesis C-methylase UbiE